MTDVNFINTYFMSVFNRMKAESVPVPLKDIFLVRTESELLGDIKNLELGSLIMAVLIPSSDTRALNIDNVKEHETWLIYILEKVDPKEVTHVNRIVSVAAQQRYITLIKQLIRSDIYNHTIPCNIRPDISSMHTDPEHLFMGCDGYSLSFKVESDDFLASNI